MSRGWLALRCDPDEKMIWEEAAKEKGMTMSAFVRSVLRGGLVCLNSAARFDKWNRAAVR